MRRILSVFIVVILLSGIPCLAQDLGGLLTSGDSLYGLHQYGESITFYRKACVADSNNAESFWKLGRSLNLLGETTPKDSQLAVFEDARDAETRALELNEVNAEAHFQLSRSLGKIALFKGIFKSASLAKKVRKESMRALEIDSLHDGAWHILGRWHREVGEKSRFLRIPMGLGAANKKDALAYMKRAVELNPDYVNHHLEMGITYRRLDNDDAARAEFEKCLELEAQRPLDEKYKKEAKKYLAELNEN
ncbi:MAG: hypothetical protein V3W18_05105 [candidate division Zixibacteria bacterium]